MPNRRIQETYGATTTDLYYNAAWQVIEERIGGTAKVQYLWGGVDILIERDRDADGNAGNGLEDRLYPLQDANGNVTALVNTSGQVVERFGYDPFGAVTFLSSSWGTLSGSAYAWRYLFQGGRYDTATGLVHFRNRELSPTLGRWLQKDPIGFGGRDANLYRVMGNNPNNAGARPDCRQMACTRTATGWFNR